MSRRHCARQAQKLRQSARAERSPEPEQLAPAPPPVQRRAQRAAVGWRAQPPLVDLRSASRANQGEPAPGSETRTRPLPLPGPRPRSVRPRPSSAQRSARPAPKVPEPSPYRDRGAATSRRLATVAVTEAIRKQRRWKRGNRGRRRSRKTIGLRLLNQAGVDRAQLPAIRGFERPIAQQVDQARKAAGRAPDRLHRLRSEGHARAVSFPLGERPRQLRGAGQAGAGRTADGEPVLDVGPKLVLAQRFETDAPGHPLLELSELGPLEQRFQLQRARPARSAASCRPARRCSTAGGFARARQAECAAPRRS